MGNCLVTQLKSSVNNNNLKYLGGIEFHFNGDTLQKRTLTLAGIVEKAVIIKDNGNTHFTSLDGTSDFGKEATEENGGIIVSGNNRFIVLSGTAECDVVVFSKYGIRTINCNDYNVIPKSLDYVGTSTEGTTLWIYYNTSGAIGSIDLGEEYFKEAKISRIHLFGKNASASITALPYINTSILTILELVKQSISNNLYELICNINTLESLIIMDSRAIADIDISKLANLTHLTNISILDIITDFGPIETFVARQRGKGRTTCSSISWTYAGYIGATFNGTAIAKNANAMTLSWTASTITFNGTEISNSDVITE